MQENEAILFNFKIHELMIEINELAKILQSMFVIDIYITNFIIYLIVSMKNSLKLLKNQINVLNLTN